MSGDKHDDDGRSDQTKANAHRVDHAVRLFTAYVAYDFHPCGYEKGCGPDCPDGYYRYTPTFTPVAAEPSSTLQT